VLDCRGRKKTPHRAPPCEELDPPYDIRLVFCAKITSVLRKINKKLLSLELHFLTPICTKAFVDWGFALDPTGGGYSAPPDPLSVFRGPASKGRGAERRGEEVKGAEEMRGEGGEGVRHLP